MKSATGFLRTLGAFTFFLGCSIALQAASSQSLQPGIKNIYDKLPLAFEINRGQSDDQVKFLTRGSGYAFFLTPQEVVLSLSPMTQLMGSQPGLLQSESNSGRGSNSVLRMTWLAGNPTPQVVGEERLTGKVNYFAGNNPADRHNNLSTFARVRYRNIYPGVDLLFYGAQQQLEYDLVLAPYADPRKIAFGFEGARGIRVAANGDLVLQLADGEIRQHRPVVYQWHDGHRQLLPGRYVIRHNQVGIEVARYDRRRTLVIDPTLAYSTYIGGTASDVGRSIAVDSTGHAYITGFTNSSNFPIKNARQGNQPDRDVFVTKFLASGGGRVYSTYLGGNLSDTGNAIAVDRSGNAYVAGQTRSSNFPTTAGAFQGITRAGGGDGFVTKLSPGGASLIYSTYLGGTGGDEILALALHSSGQAYVTGTTSSSDFPLRNPFQSAKRGIVTAFVTRLNATGTALSYSSYLGGEDAERGNGIAVDSTQHAYVTGVTSSVNFPTTPGAFQTSLRGAENVFVTKVSSTGSSLAYSTYLGGSNDDQGNGIAVDSSNRAYVTGVATSADFPVTASAFQRTKRNSAAFVTRLNASGSGLSYSTFLDGIESETGTSIAVNSSAQAHVTGFTSSPDFPRKNAVQSTFGGMLDAFVAKLSSGGSSLHYSTFLGGNNFDAGRAVRLDGSGNAYITGETASPNFPTTSGAFRRTLNGTLPDAFVAKIKP